MAGVSMRAVPVAYWLACAPTELWLEDDDGTLSEWEEPCGDRRQELGLIGQSMPRDIIEAALERCLLTDLEMARGPDEWRHIPDPFSHWDVPGSLRRRVSSQPRRLEPSREALPTGVRAHGSDLKIRSVTIRTLLSGEATAGRGEGAEASASPTASPLVPPIQPYPTPPPKHPTGTGTRCAGGSGPAAR